MKTPTLTTLRIALLTSCAAIIAAPSPATAQAAAPAGQVAFDISPQSLDSALVVFGQQTGREIVASGQATRGRRAPAVRGVFTPARALDLLLAGSGLSWRQTASGGYVVETPDPQSATAAAPDEVAALDEVVVTAQKREESIQDVPIAVSAFTAESLEDLRIDGGSELLRAIPNVTFSKSNFSMYNFAIRGIGTKAVSAASDPAVAISFNNSPLLRNRLFEQEYLDVSRVEVLRGPQGTLYGRNATAGVVNTIPNLPGPDFEAMARAEVGNYGSMRGQAMMNLPLTDTLSVRAAGSFTQRDGFDHNTFNDTDVNGRDLWSTRLSAAWTPDSRFRANLIWEHFEEDDDRSRTGKQLCTRDPGPAQVGAIAIANPGIQGKLSQGCLPGSLYDDAAYQAPNATGMAQLQILSQGGILLGYDRPTISGRIPIYVMNTGVDPYAGVTQSRDLREISTSFDPIYRATNDVFQLNLSYDLTDGLTLHSQTLYTKDDFHASQDYARYASNPIFNDSDGLYARSGRPPYPLVVGSEITPGGIYTDPQLGSSDRMLTADLSTSDNRQFYQEIRLQSSLGGAYEFSLGANYLKFETEDNYYVFNNTFSMMAEYFYGADRTRSPAVVSARCQDATTDIECVYVDYSPLSNLAGDGHNYFRSKNVVETESMAVFGELYVDLSDALRLTLGARYTDDTKVSTPYPSQLLLGYSDILGGFTTGGSIVRGLVAEPDIEQNWDALTGRAVIDWTLTPEVMLYASLARGYKGGGVNPPRPGIDPAVVQYQPLAEVFEPEYVNALEIGAKTTLLDGTLRLNGTAFFYDYSDYQVSQIVDRISLNENLDAQSMGVELEALWRPTPDFRIDANFGYLKTRIDDGERSIDVMNRTQGNDDWVLLRPWVQVPSNCIAPREHVERILNSALGQTAWLPALSALCGGAARVGTFDPAFPSNTPFYNLFGFTYNPLTDAPNGGRGFAADLSGNELPNAPRWTANIGAQYTFHLGGWELTPRVDYYRQADSFFRVYNTEYDRIRGWDNVNVAVTLENAAGDLVLQGYVKNLFDDAPIVDAFTNSDDSMLTTNVFTLDPRLIAVSLTRRF